MLASLLRDLCKRFIPGAVLFGILAPGAAEVLGRIRCVPVRLLHGLAFLEESLQRAGPVRKNRTQCAGVHLFKTKGAVSHPGRNRLPGEEQGRGAGSAVVVDVHDGDASQAEPIQGGLAGGGIAVHIAHVGMANIAVLEPRVFNGQTCGGLPHNGVVVALTGLGKGNHADAGNFYGRSHGRLLSSGSGQAIYPQDYAGANAGRLT